MKKWFGIDNLLLTGLLAAIAPFIILAFFNHASNDDYVAASTARSVGFIKSFLFTYNAWSSRYFPMTITLSYANPLILESFIAYKFAALLTIGLLFYSFFFFFHALMASVLDKKNTALLSLAVLALYLSHMPDIAGSLYWLTGAVCYQYGIILILFAAGLMIRLSSVEKTSKTPKVLLVLLACITVFLAGGTNEIAMLLQCEIIALAIVFTYIAKRRIDSVLILLFAVSLVAFCIVMFAPGIKARSSYGKHDGWFALQSSIRYGSTYLYQWLTTTPLIPAAILFASLLSKQKKFRLPFAIHPVVFFLIFIVTFYGMFFPPFYGADTLQTYTVSFLYGYFLIGMFLTLCLTLQHLAMHTSRQFPSFNKQVTVSLWLAAILLIGIPGSNLKTAWSDLLSGTAYRYDKELNERYEAIKACQAFTCDVAPLKNIPRTIYFYETAVDEKTDTPFLLQYKDNSYAHYFGKNRIRVNGPRLPESILHE